MASREEDWQLQVAVIHAEQEKATVRAALREGRVRPLGDGPDLAETAVTAASRIVGQMGVEPFQQALASEPDVIVAGRSCDVSIFAAMPLMRGFPPGLAMHMAKIVECGAYCAEPGSASDGILAVLRDDHFLLQPLSPRRRCTPLSVASHSLYEQGHPYLIFEPAGMVDVSTARFEELPDGVVRVSGSSFQPAVRPTIKLEGAVPVGYRSVSIAGIRDAIAIAGLDETIDAARSLVAESFGAPRPDTYRLIFHVYGRDGVMGEREPYPVEHPQEVGVVIEAIAADPELAGSICALARSTMLHHPYRGRRTTGGSLAFPFSPSDASWGRVYEFQIYHLWEVEDLTAPFPIELRTVGRRSEVRA